MGIPAKWNLTIGHLPHGPLNKISDVPGVTVGHCTLADGDVQTGVTALLPHPGDLFHEKLLAASHVINGFGKTTGLVQIDELGTLETPILFTNTLSVGTVETMDFEQVDYWPELCEIMDFSETNVYSTLHVCWGAQAGLYYHYGVRKHILPEKMFGVFEHKVTRPANPLVRGFDEVFYAPHSRHTGISREDVLNCRALRILAESDEAGPFLMSTENGRQIFVTGHPEYDKYTLDAEYKRDVGKGLPIAVPKNYYPNDDPEQPPLFRWRAHAHLLYENWLNYYVYQNTPYDLGTIERVQHED